MYKFYCLLIGYIFGCFQSAYILGKIFKKPDIRNYGSGNLGTTNASRVLGIKFGFAVFIFDVLKAILSCLLAKYLFKHNLAIIWSGLGVILGHDFPFFLKFKGGKGIACLIGFMLTIDYKMAPIFAIFALPAVFISRKISVGSLVFALSVPIIFFKKSNLEMLILLILIALLSIFQHRQNIIRLIKKQEPNSF